MVKLFDEVNDYGNGDVRHTLWYKYPLRMEQDTVDALKECIVADRAKALQDLANKPTESHWIFYSERVDEDAISDEVRFAVYVRMKDKKFVVNINMSDTMFSTELDLAMEFKEWLLEALQGIE